MKPGELCLWGQAVGPSFLPSAVLVSNIYTSMKLTLLNEIAFQITSRASNIALYKLAGLLLSQGRCLPAFWPSRRRALSWAGPGATCVSSVQPSELRQILLLIGFTLKHLLVC